MIDEYEREIGGYFDDCAKRGHMWSFSPMELQMLQTAMERWDIRPGHRILEPGCGSGRLTGYLARAVGPEGEVFACDLSKDMIGLASKRNLPETAVFYHGSVLGIPKEDDYFDKAVCLAVFPHFSDRTAALAEIARVLKPGGDFWIDHFRSREAINDTHENASGVIVSHLIPPENDMEELLVGAGFDVQGIWNFDRGYCVHGVKQGTGIGH